MATALKYSLSQFTNICSNGFNFEIPEDSYNMINSLSMQVGSIGLKSRIFNKIDSQIKGSESSGSLIKNNKKRRTNKGMEVCGDEWETIRTFQSTKIEQKSGVAAEIDQLRLFLNKLTDKNFLDIREKIVEKIDNICSESPSEIELNKVGTMIYDMCTTNKFYSKIFASLFSGLAIKYSWLMTIFNEHYSNIMCQYNNITYIDSEKDYNGFCEMNKTNEKRRSMTTFLMNMAINGFIEKMEVVRILRNLLVMVYNMIDVINNTNEIDELNENIAILFNKSIIDEVLSKCSEGESEDFSVNGKSIIESVYHLAKSKSKDYKSLSNKSVFKFMDLLEL